MRIFVYAKLKKLADRMEFVSVSMFAERHGISERTYKAALDYFGIKY